MEDAAVELTGFTFRVPGVSPEFGKRCQLAAWVMDNVSRPIRARGFLCTPIGGELFSVTAEATGYQDKDVLHDLRAAWSDIYNNRDFLRRKFVNGEKG
jgi:hypothetical protein